MSQQAFATKRSDVLDTYKKNNVAFIATTRALHSVRSVRFDAVNQGANGAIGYLRASAGQQLNFFAYGQNDNIALSGDNAHRANEADTNLTKAFCTPATSDMVIEWISMGAKALKVVYPATAPFVASGIDGNAASGVAGALGGTVSVVDPFARILPPEVGASATLEHTLYQAIAPNMTCRFEFDNADRTEKMGTVDQFTQGTGASYLRANGEPSVKNRFSIPEGYLWAREGQPSSQLQIITRLENDIVIPFTCVQSPLDGTWPVLTAVYL